MGPFEVSGVSASLRVSALNNKKYGETREPVNSEDVLGCPCSLGRPTEGPVLRRPKRSLVHVVNMHGNSGRSGSRTAGGPSIIPESSKIKL